MILTARYNRPEGEDSAQVGGEIHTLESDQVVRAIHSGISVPICTLLPLGTCRRDQQHSGTKDVRVHRSRGHAAPRWETTKLEHTFIELGNADHDAPF